MGASRVIARYPYIVIAAWILVALVAAPLFAQLSNVVQTLQHILPPGSESYQADQLLKQVRSSSSPTIIIVSGPDLRDNETLLKLIEWGRVYNESFYHEKLGSDLQAVPILLAEVNETIYTKLSQGLSQGVRGAREAYHALLQLNETFHQAYENVSSSLEKARMLLNGLVEADRGYAEAYAGLEQLVNATVMIVDGLRKLDAAAVNTTDQLVSLARSLNETAVRVALVDAEASKLAANLTKTAALLKTMLSNETLNEYIEAMVGFAWWQVSRTYYYMNVAQGNYTLYAMYTNLTSIDAKLAPLPEPLARQVWLNVTELVSKGFDPDNASLRVALVLVKREVETREPRLIPLLPVYAQAYWEALVAERRSLGVENITSLYSPVPGKEAVESQLHVLEIAKSVATSAALSIAQRSTQITAELIASKLVAMGVDEATAQRLGFTAVEGHVDPEAAARAVLEIAAARGVSAPREALDILPSIVAQLDPDLDARLARNWSLAVRAAATLAVRAGAPEDVVLAVARLVEMNVTSRVEYASLAYKLLAAKLEHVMPRAVGLLPIVEKYDPEASGKLLEDKVLLEKATLEVLEREAAERLSMLPRTVLEGIVRQVIEGEPPSGDELRSLALHLVEEKVREMAGEKAASMIVELLRRYDPEARGVLAENASLAARVVAEEALRLAGGKMPLTAEQLADLLLHPEKLNETYCKLFASEALEKAPSEARDLVEKAVKLLCEKWVLTPSDAWSLVHEALEKRTEEMVAKFEFGGIEPPAWLTRSIADYTVKVARNETSLEAAAAKLASRLVLETVAPKLLNETRGLLVARDYKGFLVVFNAVGSSLDERVENARHAWRLLNETLAKYVDGFDSLATGADLVSKEVREYAIHDMEKTSKISETVTFLVLLLILESVFAVVMPYIGIGLGLVLGGALVYLAAKNGLMDVTNEAQTLMITTALGLGADYAGYLVHRFREEYALFRDSRVAAERALSRAGPAIVASALTVIIGFASLLLGWDLTFLRSLGETIPVTVATTALASLTLVPALLAVLGGKRWFWWPREPRPERHAGRESRVMKWLLKHRRAVVAAFIVLFVAAGYYYMTFHGSHDIKLMLPENAEAIRAFNILKEEYMPGITDPVFIVMELPGNYWHDKHAQELVTELADRLCSIDGVGKVIAPEPNLTSGLVSEDGRIAAIEVVLDVDPYSMEGEKVVRKIHDVAHAYAERHDLNVYVGGTPYAMLEMDRLLHDRFYKRILPAAALLMLVVFTVIFGSLPVSIAALAVIIGAAMTGIMASVALFQWLMGKPVIWFLHIVTLAAVLGVGMDYNSFFLARALEECKKHACDISKALPRAAGAVSLFVLGLAAVVSGAYLSLLASSNVGMKEMGFTLGFTILLAGAMAAYLFTPLVVAMLGERAWWPYGLKKKIEH